MNVRSFKTLSRPLTSVISPDRFYCILHFILANNAIYQGTDKCSIIIVASDDQFHCICIVLIQNNSYKIICNVMSISYMYNDLIQCSALGLVSYRTNQ